MYRRYTIKLSYMTLLLLFLSTFYPSNIATSTNNHSNITNNNLLAREISFECYSPLFNSSERIKYYLNAMIEGMIQSEKNGDPHTDSSNVEDSSVCSHSIASDDGLMDSAWPMKCHDTKHTSLSPYSTSDNNGAILWKFRVENGIDAGVVVDNNGVIYFGCGDWYLYAVNPDGVLKWCYKTGGTIWSSPAIGSDGTIYIGSWDCKLYAINPDGTLKWKVGTGGSISSSPVIADDGTIYVGTMGGFEHGGYVVAVSSDGALKWKYETGEFITSDPAIGEDGTIYIGSGDTYLYAFYPNGTLKWRFKTGYYVKGPPSIAEDGTIYIGSWDDYLYALYPNGSLKWKCKVGSGTETNPSIGPDGTIYVGGDKLYAINLELLSGVST